MDCIINDYPRSEKGNKLLGVEPRGLKFLNRKCITPNDFLQKKKIDDIGMNVLETMMEKTQFEVEVPTMDTSSIIGTIIEEYDYHLTRDKVIRDIVRSQRDDYADLEWCSLNVDEWLQNKKTWTFRKAFKIKKSKKWLKNHACGIFRLPK